MNKTNMNPSHELIIHNVIKMLKLMSIIYKATFLFAFLCFFGMSLRGRVRASIDGLPNGFISCPYLGLPWKIVE